MKHLLFVLGFASVGCASASFGLAEEFDDAEVEVSSNDTNDNVDTGTPPPADTGSPPPIDTGTPPPADTGSPPPVDTGTPPPADTGSPPPIDTGTPPPVDSGTPPPVDSGTTPPTDSGAPPPIDTGTPPPVDTGPPPAPSPVTYTFPNLGDTSTRPENQLGLVGDYVKGSRLILLGHTKATLTLSYTPPAATRYVNVALLIDGVQYGDQTIYSFDTVPKTFTATFPVKPSGNRTFDLRVIACGVCDPSSAIKIANGVSSLKIQ